MASVRLRFAFAATQSQLLTKVFVTVYQMADVFKSCSFAFYLWTFLHLHAE